MAVISSLFVKLSADSAELTKEFGKTKKRAKTWSSEVTRYTKIGAAGFTAVAGAAALAAKSIYDTHAPVIDRLGKLSDSLQVNVSDLQSYRHAAELAGISTQAMDNSLLRFNRRLGKAVEGGGAAANAIKTLGFDARELANSGMDEAFQDVLDRLHEIPDQAVKNGLAFDIFGDNASEVMRLTREQIKSANKELSDFGGLLDRVDAAKVEAANDAMYRVGRATTVVKEQITVGLADGLTVMSNLFVQMGRDAGGWRVIAEDAAYSVLKAFGGLGDYLHQVSINLDLMGLKFDQAKLAVQEFFREGNGLDKIARANERAINEIRQRDIQTRQQAHNENPFSAQVEQMYKDAVAASEQAAAKIIDNNRRITGPVGSTTSPEESDKGSTEKPEEEGFSARILSFVEYREKLREEYSQLADIYRSDTQVAVDELNEKTALLREYSTLGGEEAIAARELEAQVRAEHEARLTKIAQDEAAKREATRRQELQNAIYTAGTLANGVFALLSLGNSKSEAESKKQFERNKKRSVQEAKVAGGVAIANALATSPWYVGVAQAAVALKRTRQNIANIRSTTYEGGGSLSSGADSNSSSVATDSAVSAGSATTTTESVQTSTVSNQETNVYLLQTGSGDADPEAAREQLRELVDTGAVSISGSDLDNLQIQVI